MLDLLATLVFDGRSGVLMLLLALAAVCDYRTHRIPNWLVLSGAVFGLIYNTVVPPFPQASIFLPLTGIGLGLLLFLPLYLLRAMGAGDVKLLAMVGAFLGPEQTFYAALASVIVGGAMSILYVLARGTALRMWSNLTSLLQLGYLSAMSGMAPNLRVTADASAGKLPYGVAIATGTIGYLISHRLGFF